jgi:hypothetical protein
MTIIEFKENLNSFPDDTIVVVRRYEGGHNNILSLRTVKMIPKNDSHWYDGQYDDSGNKLQ